VEASFYNVDGKNVLIEISDDGLRHYRRTSSKDLRTILQNRPCQRAGKKAAAALASLSAKHIIEAHGQAIHVRSKVDVGTTIGFSLPGKKD
jgi:two-component system phosphate regulon sensor histidine kinase PhoR